MRPSARKIVAFVVFAASMSVSASAFAEDKRAVVAPSKGAGYTESRDEAGQVVAFPDDPLGATGLDGNIPLIGTNKPPLRLQLMRPRANFVTELRRAVENL